MASAKKVVWVVVLLVILVGAVVFCISRLRRGTPKMPEKITGKPLELIDTETLELITRSVAEWDKGGRKGVYFKNPKTGKFTMSPAMTCPHCGQKIPIPEWMLAGAGPGRPGSTGGGPAGHEFKCPRCGHDILAGKPPVRRPYR